MNDHLKDLPETDQADIKARLRDAEHNLSRAEAEAVRPHLVRQARAIYRRAKTSDSLPGVLRMTRRVFDLCADAGLPADVDTIVCRPGRDGVPPEDVWQAARRLARLCGVPEDAAVRLLTWHRTERDAGPEGEGWTHLGNVYVRRGDPACYVWYRLNPVRWSTA